MKLQGGGVSKKIAKGDLVRTGNLCLSKDEIGQVATAYQSNAGAN
jgi:hypothetical protein